MCPAILEDATERVRAVACLSSQELQHAATFGLPAVRDQFLAARVLARVALSSYLGTGPQRIEFVAGAAGKPEIGAPRTEPALRFNLSHTRGLTACAVTTIGDIGVDVEEAHAVPLDVAQTLFAPPEIEALRALARSDRQEATAVTWTLKEAFVKARGDGLSLPLDAFAVGHAPPRLLPWGALIREATRWQFICASPTKTHRLAVCVRLDVAAPRPDVGTAWLDRVPE
jgi:4'-phosphopantetheinyl transferase